MALSFLPYLLREDVSAKRSFDRAGLHLKSCLKALRGLQCWQPESGRIVLLDFGATRPVPTSTRDAYHALVTAGLAGDRQGLRDALITTGFVSDTMARVHQARLDKMIATILDHVDRPEMFDFSDRIFIPGLRSGRAAIMSDRASWHVPPAETLFVQRKISGTALLAMRMKARIPVRQMLDDHR